GAVVVRRAAQADAAAQAHVVVAVRALLLAAVAPELAAVVAGGADELLHLRIADDVLEISVPGRLGEGGLGLGLRAGRDRARLGDRGLPVAGERARAGEVVVGEHVLRVGADRLAECFGGAAVVPLPEQLHAARVRAGGRAPGRERDHGHVARRRIAVGV